MNKTLQSPRDFTNWLDGFLLGKDILTEMDVEEIMGAAEDTLLAVEDALSAKKPVSTTVTLPDGFGDFSCSIRGCDICN